MEANLSGPAGLGSLTALAVTGYTRYCFILHPILVAMLSTVGTMEFLATYEYTSWSMVYYYNQRVIPLQVLLVTKEGRVCLTSLGYNSNKGSETISESSGNCQLTCAAC